MSSIHEPSDEDVEGFMAVTGAPSSRATQYLKAHNKELERAINAYFDNPGTIFDQQSQVYYDESQFHSDKAEGPQNQGQYFIYRMCKSPAKSHLKALTVHPPDTLKPNIFSDTAPSRPPSRVSTRGNDNGAVQSMDFGEPEDEQLSRAMAISMNESQILPGQETGTIDYEKQTFGPATREHYDTANWAMIHPAAHTQEILLNPEPHDRKRQPNTPAFFKTPSTGHRLSALIKILHAIPMAREALLNRTQTLQDYGHEKDWWDGTPVKVLRIVNMDADGRNINEDDVIYEGQRLMAFLDRTDRAYGSTNVLAGFEGIELQDNGKTLNFMNIWQAAAARFGSPLANIFESIGTKLDPSDPEDARSEHVTYLTVRVDNETSGKGLTLYEALDHMLWVDAKENDEIYLQKVGDIFTLEVDNQVENVSGLGIEIPPIWYADRYLPSHKQLAKDMLARKAAVMAQLQDEEKIQTRISRFQKPADGAQVDITKLLARATAYFDRKKAYQHASNEHSLTGQHSQENLRQSQAETDPVANELRALTARISDKLKTFEEVRNRAHKELKEISQLYTTPADDPNEPPCEKYTLRGVSTSANIVYVLEKTKPDEEKDILSAEAKDWQWWKVEYLSTETNPVVPKASLPSILVFLLSLQLSIIQETIDLRYHFTETMLTGNLQKVTQADVLQAATTDSRSALLVYANEKAISYESGDLPSPLLNFVRADNLSFNAELDGLDPPAPTTPTKRKADDGNLDVNNHRSPPYDRSYDAVSRDGIDHNPPSYNSSPSPPHLTRYPRISPRKAGITGSYDDMIPTSLRPTGPTIDPTFMALDPDGPNDYGQEMKERGGQKGLLHRQREVREKQGYSLGSYVPEITMEDNEEDEDQRGSRDIGRLEEAARGRVGQQPVSRDEVARYSDCMSMRSAAVPQTVFSTNAKQETFRPDYLRVAAKHENTQPLCGNREGWGPISPFRYDFTPCFLDVWISVVAVFGIVCGAAALWWLLKKRSPSPVGKNWHFYTKLAVIAALLFTTALQACLQIDALPGVWFGDFRFWTSIITLVSLAIIGGVQYIEHWRSRQPNGIVLFYWLFLLIAFGVKLRSLISQQAFQNRLPYFVTFCVGFGLAACEFALEYLIPKKQSAYDALGDEDECPIEYADIFSVLTFSWMTPLMKYGYKEYLTQDDLWNLRRRDTTKVTGDALEEMWADELEKKRPSLWIAMFRGFGGPYFWGSVIKTVSDTLSFVQPQLLRLLISFVDSYRSGNPHPQPVIRGAAISLAMFAVSVAQSALLHQYFQRAFETGMRVKSSLTSMIYAKSMRLSNEGRASKSTGDIVNYMAVDTQRLQELTQYGQMLWSAPFQIVLCMLSLYQLVGISMLAGVAAMLLMVPVNGVIARIMKNLQKRQMKNKDSRTRLVTEILNNMKSIKLFAWSQAFMNKLNFVRNEQELKTLRKIGASQAIANFTWSTTPFLVSCSTFTVFVLTRDEPLTTEIVFPALTLFNLLGFPLAILPMVITSIIEATVAVGRLTSFFAAEELQSDAVQTKDAAANNGDESVRVWDATFTWDRKEGRHCLEDINFVARKGELSCIVGRVGAGKSSFLEAILGDIWKIHGEVVVHGRTAYVAQQAWVMNASVKENIVFGHRWDPRFYERTINACALTEDLKTLPDGDQTEVGERGISLSGGQKARLTLARAVYARADVYLLDDCLSAVDQHVGRHLIENVLGSKGLLAGKTRILATNSIPVLLEADFVTLIRDGRILEKGTFEQLIAMKGEVSNLIRTANNEEEQETPSPSVEDSKESTSSVSEDSNTVFGTGTGDSMAEEKDQAQEGIVQLAPIRVNAGTGRRASYDSLRRASTASFKGPRGKVNDEEGEGVKSKQSKEFSEQGKVKWNVYLEYAKTSNLIAVCIYLITLISAQTAQIGGSLWLKQWSEVNQEYGGNPQVGKYIGIYFAFGVGGAGLVVIQTLILWIFCSIEASRKLHERMAYAIFRSPMTFFETTPSGRILNRFSSDIYRVDEVLARTFNMLFVNCARAFYTLILIAVSTPVFVALIIPLGAIYLYIQRYYLRTSRELKRLDSISRSPIYAHFQESLGGITTIRAYRQQSRFALENEWRVDANLRAYFPSIHANRWLAVRLEFIGSFIILAAASFSIISVATGSGLSAGLVGLAMSYALQITTSLNWIVRQTVEVETNIVSVERVLEYARLPSEAPDVISKHRPKISWPAQGAVGFHNYSARYRPGLDLVLKNINIHIKSHEKIGVVGRTGAGKSSLTLALFRIIEPDGGYMSIDDLNTSTIGLFDLRGRLAIIPQDAALFEGTIRDNLDPGHIHDDTELWSVLDHARLKEHVSSMQGGLEASVHEGGSNLSAGQRQLVSLARALLTPTNILVLDEATAAVDVETDAMLQTTLRSNMFKDRTIITIAHRINTILDSDRIVVLDHGTVAEFDTPSALVHQRGLFYELVKEAGLLDSVEQ